MRTIAWLAVLALTLPPTAAHALNTHTYDLNDTWWNPAESGWAINVTHQRDVVVALIYAYGANGQSKWFVASDMRPTPSAGAAYAGDLYEVTGTHFASPFIASAVNARKVGTASIVAGMGTFMHLSYTVDGVQVVKNNLERYTFRYQTLGGQYLGTIASQVTGCGQTLSFEYLARIGITHDGASNFLMTTAPVAGGRTCSYAGQYTQSGRWGRISATFACTDGLAGSITVSELEAGTGGFLGKFVATYGNCREDGRISGMK